MDPITVIGVASGILTFISVAAKVVKIGQGVCNSIRGSEQENMSRETIIAEMKDLMCRIPEAGDPQLVQEDESLCRLIEECRKIAQELLCILSKIKPKGGKSTFASLRTAIRQVTSQREMENLETRLDHCRGQLELHLNVKYFNQTKALLDQLLSQAKIDKCQLTKLRANFEQLNKGVVIEALSEDAHEQLRRLLGIHKEALQIFQQEQILQSLRYPGMLDRYEMLDPADEMTFQWIFEDEDKSSSHESSNVPHEYNKMRFQSRKKLVNWLSSSEGFFHICDKLGSGKSTLMKYLCQHHRTKTALENWAGDKRLVLLNFFFWKPGSTLQKSLAGLCGSILHGLLQSCPELIQLALPEHWSKIGRNRVLVQSALEISAEEVQTALVRLIGDKRTYAKNRFCLFIDGLDEYEQTTRYDYRTVVNMLRTWVDMSSGNLKVCVSSREYNVFMNSFSDGYRLRLHELTLYDIRAYVRNKLSDLPSGEIKEDLMVAISDKADGIFFWVALVVQSMRESIEDGINISDLKDLLNSLPPGLEELFHSVLFKLEKQKRIKAYETFSMLSALKAGDFPPLSMLAYSFYDHYKKDDRFAFRDDFFADANIDIAFIEKRVEFARKQLRANCGGLLESSPTPKDRWIREAPGGKIEYTHRSVPEYLLRLRDQVDTEASSHGFNAIDAVSSLIVAEVRLMDCIDGEASNVTCAGLAHLRLANNVDKEPFEFLEYLDSRVDEPCWRRMEEADDILFGVEYRKFHLVPHRFSSETRHTSEQKIVAVHYPLWQAFMIRFNGYIKWKLEKEPRTVNSPFKRMLIAHAVLSRGENYGITVPWDCLFDNGVFSDEVLQCFFGINPEFTTSRYFLWDLSQLTKLSALNQYLINVFTDWCWKNEALGRFFHSSPGWVGQVIEEFLKRSTTNIHFEALVETRDVGKGQSLIVKVTIQLEEASQIVIDCFNNQKPIDYVETPSWLLNVGVHGDRGLNSDKNIRVSFWQFIESCMPDIKGRLLLLLERNAGHADPAIQGTSELGHLTDLLEKKEGPPQTTPYHLSERQDENDKEIKTSVNRFAAWYFLGKNTNLVFVFALGECQVSALNQASFIAFTNDVYGDDG